MLRLLPALAERGHEINVIGLFDREAPNLKHLELEYGILHTQLPPSIRFTPSRVRWLVHEVKKSKPDLFVPNCFCEGLYAAREIQMAGIACLGYIRSFDDFYRAVIDEFVSCENSNALSGFACVSEQLREMADARLPNDPITKLFFLPSGVPVPTNTQTHRPGELTACYVGRFVDEQKRFTDTANALLKALEKQTLSRVGFVGSGELSEWLTREIKSRALQNAATIHGPVSPDDLGTLLADYQIAVLLSDYEGTPGALMDAMANGLIPVTTHIPGGTEELVQHKKTGIVCKNRGKSFQNALQELKASPALRQILSENARELINTNYSIEQTVDRFERIALNLQQSARHTSSRCRRKKPKFQISTASMRKFVSLPWDRSSSLKDAAICEYSIRVKASVRRIRENISNWTSDVKPSC